MKHKTLFLLFFVYNFYNCSSQSGPDPWDYSYDSTTNINEVDLPLDMSIPLKNIQKGLISKSNAGMGEWSFKRTLAILLKGGHIKKYEDGSIHVSLQMKYDPEKWETLDSYLKWESAFTEDMFRRTLGYIEESIYKPSVMENIVMAWTDYVQEFFINYKIHITWTLVCLSAIAAMVWLWHHTSHLIIVIIALLYLYQVFVSYKEAEQKELETFMNAVQTCKWHFWKSSCEVPTPDLLVFLNHMNPMKVAIRMLTTLITEPVLTVSGTVKIIVQDITDELWFPLDKIAYLILIVSIHVLLILFLIMVLFNYILNIPFNLSIFGLVSFGMKQRIRTIFPEKRNKRVPIEENDDRIRGDTLDKILDVLSLTLKSSSQVNNSHQIKDVTNIAPSLKRSASLGRMPISNTSFDNHMTLEYNKNVTRNVTMKHRGGGDHS